MEVERYDKQPEPREEEIKRDWRKWANSSGYIATSTIELPQGISLEVWENPLVVKDAYLLYLPNIPKTVGAEKLCIITERRHLNFMVDALKKVVAIGDTMMELKRYYKDGQN